MRGLWDASHPTPPCTMDPTGLPDLTRPSQTEPTPTRFWMHFYHFLRTLAANFYVFAIFEPAGWVLPGQAGLLDRAEKAGQTSSTNSGRSRNGGRRRRQPLSATSHLQCRRRSSSIKGDAGAPACLPPMADGRGAAAMRGASLSLSVPQGPK
eukprot:gene24534-biopygen8950